MEDMRLLTARVWLINVSTSARLLSRFVAVSVTDCATRSFVRKVQAIPTLENVKYQVEVIVINA